MSTLSLKLPDPLLLRLDQESRQRRMTKSSLVRATLVRGVVRIALEIEDQASDLRMLMQRYRDWPMSLADACLVRLAELHKGGMIFTLNENFRIYRRHDNKMRPDD